MATRNLSVRFGTEGFQEAISSLRQVGRSFEATLRSAQTEVEQAARAMAAAQRANDNDAFIRAQQERMRAARNANAAIQNSYRQLGVRSSADIEAMKRQAIDAYNALKASGVASANDIRRAKIALRQQLQSLNAQLNQGRGASNLFGNALQGLGRSAGNAGGQFTVLKGTLANLFSSAIINQVNNLSNAFNNLKAQVLDVGATAERQQIAFKTFLGGDAEAAKKMVQEVRDFAATTPFELPEVSDAAKQLLAVKTPTEEIIPIIRMLGEVAAGADVPLSQLLFVYKQIKNQGFAYGQDINQLTNAGLAMSDFAEAMGKSSAEMAKMKRSSQGLQLSFEDVFKTLLYVTGEQGRFYNLMSSLSDTTAVKLTNIKDAYTKIYQSIYDGIAPAIGAVLDTIVAIINPLSENKNIWTEINAVALDFQNYLKANPQIIKSIVDLLETTLKGALDAVAEAAKSVLDYLQQNPDIILKTIKLIKDLTLTIGKGLRSVFQVVVELANAILKSLEKNPQLIEQSIKTVGQLVNKMKELATELLKIIDLIKNMGKGFKEALAYVDNFYRGNPEKQAEYKRQQEKKAQEKRGYRLNNPIAFAGEMKRGGTTKETGVIVQGVTRNGRRLEGDELKYYANQLRVGQSQERLGKFAQIEPLNFDKKGYPNQFQYVLPRNAPIKVAVPVKNVKYEQVGPNNWNVLITFTDGNQIRLLYSAQQGDTNLIPVPAVAPTPPKKTTPPPKKTTPPRTFPQLPASTPTNTVRRPRMPEVEKLPGASRAYLNELKQQQAREKERLQRSQTTQLNQFDLETARKRKVGMTPQQEQARALQRQTLQREFRFKQQILEIDQQIFYLQKETGKTNNTAIQNLRDKKLWLQQNYKIEVETASLTAKKQQDLSRLQREQAAQQARNKQAQTQQLLNFDRETAKKRSQGMSRQEELERSLKRQAMQREFAHKNQILEIDQKIALLSAISTTKNAAEIAQLRQKKKDLQSNYQIQLQTTEIQAQQQRNSLIVEEKKRALLTQQATQRERLNQSQTQQLQNFDSETAKKRNQGMSRQEELDRSLKRQAMEREFAYKKQILEIDQKIALLSAISPTKNAAEISQLQQKKKALQSNYQTQVQAAEVQAQQQRDALIRDEKKRALMKEQASVQRQIEEIQDRQLDTLDQQIARQEEGENYVTSYKRENLALEFEYGNKILALQNQIALLKIDNTAQAQEQISILEQEIRVLDQKLKREKELAKIKTEQTLTAKTKEITDFFTSTQKDIESSRKNYLPKTPANLLDEQIQGVKGEFDKYSEDLKRIEKQIKAVLAAKQELNLEYTKEAELLKNIQDTQANVDTLKTQAIDFTITDFFKDKNKEIDESLKNLNEQVESMADSLLPDTWTNKENLALKTVNKEYQNYRTNLEETRKLLLEQKEAKDKQNISTVKETELLAKLNDQLAAMDKMEETAKQQVVTKIREEKQQSVQERFSSYRDQIQSDKIDKVRSGGMEFKARAMERELAIAQEMDRYKQEVKDIEQEYADDPAKMQEFLDKAKAINQIKLDGIKQEFKSLGETIKDIVADGIIKLFEDIILNAVSVGEAFKNLAKMILEEIAKIFIKMAALSLIRGLSGAIGGIFGGGSTTMSGVAGSGAIMAAEGGPVTGPGTETSDSILARLSDGEFVIRAKAVKNVGVNFLNKLNQEAKLPVYAQGGLVSVGFQTTQEKSKTERITNNPIVHQNIEIKTPDANSFRKSNLQIAKENAELMRRALTRNG